MIVNIKPRVGIICDEVLIKYGMTRQSIQEAFGIEPAIVEIDNVMEEIREHRFGMVFTYEKGKLIYIEVSLNVKLMYKEIDVFGLSNSIEFLQNEVETTSRINFWDCYCVGIEEWMSAGGAPMGIELLLSPAIVKKDALVHEKVWKITDVHGNTEEVKVEEETKKEDAKPVTPPTPLITAVTGKTSALPNAVVEYEVASYNISNISSNDKERIKWMVKVDGKQELQKQQGEKIRLTIKEEWAGKEITVMPYLKAPNEKVSVKTEIHNTKHYKVIPSLGSIRKDFDLPPQMSQYTINHRKTNEITIQRLEKKISFHSAVVELGIKKITSDYNTRFSNGFPDEYYNEFGRYITELLIYKHQLIKLNAPIKEALNEVVKLLDSESGFNNGLGAPLFHIYENVVRKNDDTGFDKLLHFMFSAKHAYNFNPTISKSLGIAKEFIKDEMYSWIDDDEKGWDDLDMRANEKGIEYGTELESR